MREAVLIRKINGRIVNFGPYKSGTYIAGIQVKNRIWPERISPELKKILNRIFPERIYPDRIFTESIVNCLFETPEKES